jgi:hypothetical protein
MTFRSFWQRLVLLFFAQMLFLTVVRAVDTVTANNNNPNPTSYTLDASMSTAGSSTYTVKPGVTSLYVALCGASGGGSYPGSNVAGNGGCIYTTIAVTSSQTLYITVGGPGTAGVVGAGGSGGIGGGGSGGCSGTSYSGGECIEF